MAEVHIPAPLRTLTGGETTVTIPGETLREVLDRLDEAYPGLKERLVQGDRLAPRMAGVGGGALPPARPRARLAPGARSYVAPALARRRGTGGRRARDESGQRGNSSC